MTDSIPIYGTLQPIFGHGLPDNSMIHKNKTRALIILAGAALALFFWISLLGDLRDRPVFYLICFLSLSGIMFLAYRLVSTGSRRAWQVALVAAFLFRLVVVAGAAGEFAGDAGATPFLAGGHQLGSGAQAGPDRTHAGEEGSLVDVGREAVIVRRTAGTDRESVLGRCR